ncbi:MAG: galactose mutarotase [Bacteroidales bacterium]|nr:galactose mutarotase [Candidatus Liminaster caballi]
MKTYSKFLAMAAMALPILSSCSEKQPVELTKSGLNPENFVSTVRGKQTALYTLTNENGMEVCITNLGGRIVSIMAPDRNGELRDVVLGFDNVKSYANEDGKTASDFGACIGRFANRIAGGKFTLDGVEYTLPCNDKGLTCLHGGPMGWQYQVYDAEMSEDGSSVTMTIVSPDGDNSFPGTVTASCTYILNDDNSLVLDYQATTDAPTVINMTNHSYFNLSGDPTKTVLADSLLLVSNTMTPTDAALIPTGELAEIGENTPFDFLHGFKTIGQDIEADDENLKLAGGYDHNWVILPQPKANDFPVHAALMSPESGIILVVKSDQPGIQCYTGNFLDGTLTGKNGIVYQKRTGICLETQRYPDSPNKPEWPTTVLRPGEQYHTTTIFEFRTPADFQRN